MLSAHTVFKKPKAKNHFNNTAKFKAPIFKKPKAINPSAAGYENIIKSPFPLYQCFPTKISGEKNCSSRFDEVLPEKSKNK